MTGKTLIAFEKAAVDEMVKQTTLLVVDDDARVLGLMNRLLEQEGYRVIKASNGQEALDMFDQEMPDLILLDVTMPVMDGYTVCRRIREFSQTPIIMVTARGRDDEKIQGLDAGADDYVTKPFSPKELAARVRAALRRTKLWEEHPEPSFHSDNLVIDFFRHKVTIEQEEIELTATEYRILSYLARNAGRVITPDQLLENVWGEEYVGESHLLQVNIARLRSKLGDDARNPRYIVTRQGIGYTMSDGAR